MSQPPKSTIFAPRARCVSLRMVFWVMGRFFVVRSGSALSRVRRGCVLRFASLDKGFAFAVYFFERTDSRGAPRQQAARVSAAHPGFPTIGTSTKIPGAAVGLTRATCLGERQKATHPQEHESAFAKPPTRARTLAQERTRLDGLHRERRPLHRHDLDL